MSRHVNARLSRHADFWLYMVECADGTYYAGYTRDLTARVRLHNAGRGAKYLAGKRPVSLVYAKHYRYYLHAVRAERHLKQQSRKFKEALVRRYAEARSG